jgi:diacylglycerol kinase family enzyme
MSNERPVLVLNPAAAGGRVGRNRDALVDRIRAALPDLDVVESGPSGARQVAMAAVNAGATHVLSLGGDGTHSQVGGAIIDAQKQPGSVRFSPLPAGTGGDFSRLLRGERRIERVLQHVHEEGTVIDAAAVTLRDHQGNLRRQPFINVGSFGVAGLVDEAVNRSSKRWGGTIAFGAASVASFSQYRPAPMRISVDGVVVFEGPIVNAAVCNGQYYGGGMWVGSRARLLDGLLDLVIFPALPLHRILPIFAATYRGHHLDHPAVVWKQGRVIEAVATDIHSAWADIDGEPLGVEPYRVEVLPGVLRVTGLRADV